jgi:hypothetical protein
MEQLSKEVFICPNTNTEYKVRNLERPDSQKADTETRVFLKIRFKVTTKGQDLS